MRLHFILTATFVLGFTLSVLSHGEERDLIPEYETERESSNNREIFPDSVLDSDGTPMECKTKSRYQNAHNELMRLEQTYNMNVESWKARADEVRRGFVEGAKLSPLPVRTPMSTIIHSKKIKNGYTIENVGLEVSPGYWVTGNLYRPLGREGKRPAIVHPIGHFKKKGWKTRTQPEMQARAGHLAQMGAVVFAYDMVGWGESWQVPHSSKRAVALQTWNSMRVIDFLETLPEVDTAKIAMTGASGGGTQTIFAAAVDPRIAVSAPIVKVTAVSIGGCTCEMGMNTHKPTGTNNTEIAALVAPKPLLIVTDGKSSDYTRCFPSLEAGYVQHIYDLYGSESSGNFKNVHLANETHNFGITKRKVLYDFFAEHLGLEKIPLREPKLNRKGEIDDEEEITENVTIEKSDSLLVWSNGHKRPNLPMILLPSTWPFTPEPGEDPEDNDNDHHREILDRIGM